MVHNHLHGFAEIDYQVIDMNKDHTTTYIQLFNHSGPALSDPLTPITHIKPVGPVLN